MTPVFTTKAGKQHRYYVTRLKPGEDRKAAWRVPAGDLDRAVVGCVERALPAGRPSLDLRSKSRSTWTVALSPEQRKLLLENDVRVQLGSDEIVITVGGEPGDDRIEIPARLARRGIELKLVLPSDGAEAAEPDPVLLKFISHAALAQQAALTGEPDAIVSGYSKRHLWQLLRVSWLAPDIIAPITEGRQPPTLTGRRLLRAAGVPLSWADQRRYFGFS